MYLKWLELRAFRSYEELSLLPETRGEHPHR